MIPWRRRNTVANFLLKPVFNNKVGHCKTYEWEDEIKSLVISNYELSFQFMLNIVGEVFNSNGT